MASLPYTYLCPVLCIGATYPLALVGQFSVDILAGDAQILRESMYGYRRLLAAKLVDGWFRSLLWVVAFWLGLHALRRYLPRLHVPLTALAIGAAFAVSAGGLLPIPMMFAWLLTAAALLHGLCARSAPRPALGR